jgi:hypothetical protein
MISFIMPVLGPWMEGKNKERRRLEALYAGMTEAELRTLSEGAASLTEPARQTLRVEMSRRGLSSDLSDSAVPSGGAQLRVLVTLRQYGDLPGALLARSILESAGIECFLGDDNLIRMDWLWSNLLGGVKLRVRPEDADAAAGLLALDFTVRGNPEEGDEHEQSHCPGCHAVGMPFAELNKFAAAAGAVSHRVSVPLSRRRWKCRSCGHEWPESAAATA